MRSAMLSAEVFFRRGEACIMYSRHLGRAQVFTLLPIGINPLTFHQNNKPTGAHLEPPKPPFTRMPDESEHEEVCWD